MKKILLIVFSNLKHDARMMRHVNFLKTKYALTVACHDAPDAEDFAFIKLPDNRLTLLKKMLSAGLLLGRLHTLAYRVLYPYQSFAKKFAAENYDLVIANDIETLPLAFDAAGPNTKIFFDAHEYAPRHFENVRTWRIFFQPFNIHLCNKYIPRVNAMITVGKKIAEEYHKHFGVNPQVVTNAPPYREYKPRSVSRPIRLVHHGIATPSRKIEIMIDMMKILPDHFTLDLVLMTPPSASAQTKNYLNELKTRAAINNRITFVPPVPVAEILPLINQYDIGLMIIPPINFNYENSLPNKFFDYIQARVAVAAGPTPEVAEIVKEFKLGVVSHEFSAESLADKIKNLTAQEIEEFKSNSNLAAQIHNAEKNKSIMLGIIGNLLP